MIDPSTPPPPPPLAAIPDRGGARSRKYGASAVNAICDAIRREGIPDRQAALRAQVSSQTLSQWKRRHADFAQQLERARADFIRQRLVRIAGLEAVGQRQFDDWKLPDRENSEMHDGRAK